MQGDGPVPIVDVFDARFRERSIFAGVLLTFAVCVSGLVYTFATWDRPHRAFLTALFVVAMLVGGLVSLAPADRIVRSRLREAFFLTWSFADLLLILVLAKADGGARSPLALIFFVPIVFAALSYPLRSTVIVGAVTVLSFLTTGLVDNAPDGAYLGFSAACLALTALMCAWQAHNHERQREELQLISRADPLTDCLNRRGFEERLEAALAESAREGRPFSLVVMDLDHFKRVNDTHGHAAGDELLRWTVSALHGVLRPADALGRLGGDEFAVVVPGAGRAEAAALTERLSEALAPRSPATMGWATFPVDGTDRDALHRHADSALYAAKHGRRGAHRDEHGALGWAAALAAAVDARMAVSHDHASAVARHAAVIAEGLGWTGADLALLRTAAMLHDVGKVAISDAILRKPGKLTAAEYEEIKAHPVVGAEMVSRIEGLAAIVPWIRHAHEHVDGSGYPDGLRGEAIPMAARVLLVADAFDAMTSDRPYRRALSVDEALAELRREAGSQFDARCVELLAEHLAAAEIPAP